MILYTVHSVYNLNGKCKEKKNAFHLPNFENKDAKLCFFLAIWNNILEHQIVPPFLKQDWTV